MNHKPYLYIYNKNILIIKMRTNTKNNVSLLKPGVVRKLFHSKNASQIINQLPQQLLKEDTNDFEWIEKKYIKNYIIMTKLKDNPYIIKMIENNVTDKLVIDMEEMQMTLEEWETKYKRTVVFKNNLLKIALWSGLGIKAIHEIGYIHNDIHSLNVLVNVDELGNIITLRIIDFDLSKPHTTVDNTTVDILRYIRMLEYLDSSYIYMGLYNAVEENTMTFDEILDLFSNKKTKIEEEEEEINLCIIF